MPANAKSAKSKATRRSTALPADFVVRHEIPEGMRVSLQGLGRPLVRLFGTEMKKRAGLEVWDEEKFWKDRHEAAVAAAGGGVADGD